MKKIIAALIALSSLFPFSAKGMESFNLKQSVNRFSINLFNVTNKAKNSFLSPYSIYLAFGPIYEGAAGKTEEELKIGFEYPEKCKLRKAVLKELKEKIKTPLKIFNGLYVERRYNFLRSYINIVKTYYLSEVKKVDFIDPEKRYLAIKLINNDVKNATEGKIKDLIHPSDVNRLTRLININAIYFKDSWKKPFNKNNTKKRPFFTGNKTISVPTMETTGYFKIYKSQDVKAVSIPYRSGFEMTIIVPQKNFNLTLENYRKIKRAMKRKFIKLYLPKFHIKERLYLKKYLVKLHVVLPFTWKANFKNMDGTKNLYIQKAIHQTFIDVNENGTEAAAATAVIVGLKCIPPEPGEVFRVDRPFIFTISDKKGTILFIGSVRNPEEKE
ncbi:serpin family protein [Desulfurobacterium sp.]